MNDLCRKLQENEARLSQAWGDALPPCSETLLQQVDQLVGNPAELTGRQDALDWDGGGTFRIPEKLATAFRHTGEERYVRAAAAWFSWWIEQENMLTPDWEPPDDPLAICHRIGDTEVPGWLACLPIFCGHPAFSAEQTATCVEAARIQLQHLAAHPYHARNMRMSQMDCLLTSSLRLDFLPEAATWQQQGLRGLNDLFVCQFNPDGSSVECAGWYHYIVANMALRFFLLNRHRPELKLRITARQVATAFDYTAACILPDGTFNRIGDCTAAVVPFQTLDDFLTHHRQVRMKLGLPPRLPPVSGYFPDCAQALLRDNWSSNATCITLDASVRHGFHWHPAAGGIQLFTAGRRLLADPGRMTYQPTPQRAYAQSTRGHNTLNINGWNQSSCPARLRHQATRDHEIVTCFYAGGYWPGATYTAPGHGLFAEHHRTLLWVKRRFIVVLDHLFHASEPGTKPDIESNWQFTPGPLEICPETRQVRAERGPASLALSFPLCPDNAELQCGEGEINPAAGWIADANDRPVPAPQLRLLLPQYDPWNLDLAAVLLLGRGKNEEPEIQAIANPENDGYGCLILNWPDGTQDKISWTRKLATPLPEVAGIATDAALTHAIRQPKAATATPVFRYPARPAF